MSLPYAKQQPSDGETCLVCPHTEKEGPFHFLMLAGDRGRGCPVINKITGEKDVAHWIILCNACFEAHAADPMEAVAGVRTWKNDDPIILDNRN